MPASDTTFAVPFFTYFFDDAAVFPPGSASLPDAVRDHAVHRQAWYREMVGPLVIPASALGELAPLIDPEQPPVEVALTMTDGSHQLAAHLAHAATIGVRVEAVEIALAEDADVESELSTIATSAGSRPAVFIELPRDGRRGAVLSALASTDFVPKLRTRGVRADLYPSSHELAETIVDVVAAGLPFKATAGLHHAVRNTDPSTGFDQHGFLNLLLAAEAAGRGAGVEEIVGLLELHDDVQMAELFSGLDAAALVRARTTFVSIGTCSISDPLSDLARLGLMEGHPEVATPTTKERT